MELNGISRDSHYHDEANSARDYIPTLWHRPLCSWRAPIAPASWTSTSQWAPHQAEKPESTNRDHWENLATLLDLYVSSLRQPEGCGHVHGIMLSLTEPSVTFYIPHGNGFTNNDISPHPSLHDKSTSRIGPRITYCTPLSATSAIVSAYKMQARWTFL